MPAQEKLSPTEQIVAYIIGGGITLVVIALFLYGLNAVESNVALSLLLVGLAVFVIGTGAWLYLLRPWDKFDDLTTPHFTGHHEGEDAEHIPATPPATAQPHVTPSAMPVDRTAAAEAPSDLLGGDVPPATAAAAAPADVLSEDVPPSPTPPADTVTAPEPETEAEVVTEPEAETIKATAEPDVAEAKPEPTPETPADVFAEETPPTAEPADATPPASEKAEPTDPIPAAEPGAEPDDLALLDGVGPKSAEALNASGITTFKQVAAMSPVALEDAVKSQKVRLVGSTETWPMQAELAAEGDFSALDDLKERIQGGYLYEDLTLIEGVGPKVQEVLYEAGFRRYGQIAAATPDALRAALEAADLRMMSPDTWPQQAQLLLENKTTELAELQANLKGGRA